MSAKSNITRNYEKNRGYGLKKTKPISKGATIHWPDEAVFSFDLPARIVRLDAKRWQFYVFGRASCEKE